MPAFAKIRSFVRNLFSFGRVDASLDEEIHSHLDMLVEENIRSGMPPEEAKRAARLELGGLEQLKEQVREARIGSWFRSVLFDCRYGIRQLRRTPGFSAVAISTLALGIGANTAIFSVLQGVVLAPLPYEEPDRLVMIWLYNQTLKHSTFLSYSDFLDWDRNARSFRQMAAFTPQSADLTSPGTPEHLEGKRVSWGFFSTLGVKLALGREFTRHEDVHGGAPVAVISNRLWIKRFARSPQAIGKSVVLNGVDHTIAGVLPPGFSLLTSADVYMPLGQGDPLQLGDRATHNMSCIARLKPEVSISQAQAEMAAVQEHLGRLHPNEERGLGAEIVPLKQELTGNIRGTLLLLLAAVAVVLLIACANVANLLLARSAGRMREFAVRSALGASRFRIVRQLLTEGLILSLTGAVFGLALARLGLNPLLAAVPERLPRSGNIGLSVPVLVFAFCVSILVAVLFSLAPALEISKLDLQTSLKKGGRTSTSSHSRVQGLLVIIQVALTLVLLMGASLLLSTVRQLWAVHPGFDTMHIMTFKVGLAPDATQTPAKMRIAYQQMIQRLREIPGIEAASATTLLPLSQADNSLPFWLGSKPPASVAEAPRALSYSVGPGYLKVMGIPLLRGRFFTLRDNNRSAPVIVIDSNLARSYFPGTDAVGQTINFIHVGAYQVIGVVGHVRHWGLDDMLHSPYQVYSALYQISDQWLPVMYPDVTVIVRTQLDAGTVLPAIKAAVRETGSGQPVYDLQNMQQLASRSMSQRFPMILMTAFAGLALLLASVGIYGVISYSVSRRVQEIGIRMALGAGKSNIFRAVIGQGLRLTLAGVAIGGVAALLLVRFVSSFSSLLYGVSENDPITFASVSFLLILVGVLACYIPARRATRVDPMTALRQE